MLDRQISLGYDKKSVVINLNDPKAANIRSHALIWGKDVYSETCNFNIEVDSTKIIISGNNIEEVCNFLVQTTDLDEESRKKLLSEAKEATYAQRTFKSESQNSSQAQKNFGQSSQARQSPPTPA